MCILEAVGEESPWGRLVDAAVRYQVGKGDLPLKPLEDFTDLERALVKMKCASRPLERISISTIAEKLDKLAKHEDAAKKVTLSLPSANAAP
jgi:hypothetical protein